MTPIATAFVIVGGHLSQSEGCAEPVCPASWTEEFAIAILVIHAGQIGGVSMSAETDIAARVRAALADAGAIREVKMFGGIGFMLNGNLIAGASKRGLLLRVGKDRQRDAVQRPGARAMEMRGRVMEDYIYVDPSVLTAAAIKNWLALAVAFVNTLPPKTPGTKARRTTAKRTKTTRT